MGDAGRGEIEILLNPRDIQAVEDRMERIYRKTWGPDVALEGSRAGVVMQDPYVLVIRDAVRFPSGKTGLYYRKISRTVLDGGSPGAFCLPLNAAGRVVMIKEYRHQQRGWRLSIPGGFRDPGETSEQAARREAMEETGITLGAVEALGDIEAEGEAVPLFVGQESTRLKILKPDEGEALGAVVELTPHELKQAVVAGGFRDRDGTWLAVQGALGSAVLKLEHWLAQQPHEEILQTTYATP
jgi:ADP-ribose pyrophosphatase